MSERWGKYEIISLIARGGMAEVFRAHQFGPSGFVRPVCLKCVRSEYSCDPEFVSMFEAEARIAATLQHPNIVQVSDFDRHEGRLFLVLELVDGWDLRHIIARARQLGLVLPIPFAVAVMEGLLLALAHAHGRVLDGVPTPVVHRDVSPHNILLSVEGAVKLADFGIAKARGLSNATRTGIVKGKLAYLSPEQARGEAATPACDLFSAGLVLYEMLSGRRALAGEDDRALTAQLHRFSAAPIPGLSEPLMGFVFRLLSPEPEERFGSAEEALVALRGLGIPAAPMKDIGKLVGALRRLPPDPDEVSVSVAAHEPSSGAASSEVVEQTHISEPQGIERPLRKSVLVIVVVVVLLALLVVGGWWLRENIFASSSSTVSTAPLALPAAEKVGLPSPAPRPDIRTLSPPQEVQLSNDSSSLEDAAAGPQDQPRPARSSESTAFGTLSVFVRPWANVAIDGVPRGQTPLKNVRLSTGPHRLLLSNNELAYKRNFEITIEPGEQEIVNRTIPRP